MIFAELEVGDKLPITKVSWKQHVLFCLPSKTPARYFRRALNPNGEIM